PPTKSAAAAAWGLTPGAPGAPATPVVQGASRAWASSEHNLAEAVTKASTAAQRGPWGCSRTGPPAPRPRASSDSHRPTPSRSRASAVAYGRRFIATESASTRRHTCGSALAGRARWPSPAPWVAADGRRRGWGAGAGASGESDTPAAWPRGGAASTPEPLQQHRRHHEDRVVPVDHEGQLDSGSGR